MAAYFDEAKWDEFIKDPLWYLGALYDECEALMQRAEREGEKGDPIKKAVRSYFADRLERGMVALDVDGADEDSERKPIDTIVIHHTSGPASNYALQYLNAVQLLRIYIPKYRAEGDRYGKPLWSGHFYRDQQVFWGYHWFINEDGSYERILPDTAVGWHAGNWDVNTRSVGICFAGNFMEQPPNPAMIVAAQNIIRGNYPGLRIIGHYEAPRDTTCPGATFTDWRCQLG